jgi:V/A-type H+-transporting ATPase subunit G/H
LVEELIKGIKTAELNAEELIKNAQAEARQMLAAAEAKAEAMRAEALKKAKETAQVLLTKGEEQGQAEAVPIAKKREQEIKALKEAAAAKMEAAVAMITERIVKSDGNS